MPALGQEPRRVGSGLGFSFFGFLTSFLRLLLPLAIAVSQFEFTQRWGVRNDKDEVGRIVQSRIHCESSFACFFCPKPCLPPRQEKQKRVHSGWRKPRRLVILPPLMGDKSPKATNKQAAQKQAKANTNTQKKSNAAAAKQAVKPKK